MAFSAKLSGELEEADHRNEETPTHRIFNFLDIDDPKHENNFVEHQIPELILDVFLLRRAKVSKHGFLDRMAEDDEKAVNQVHKGLRE